MSISLFYIALTLFFMPIIFMLLIKVARYYYKSVIWIVDKLYNNTKTYDNTMFTVILCSSVLIIIMTIIAVKCI